MSARITIHTKSPFQTDLSRWTRNYVIAENVRRRLAGQAPSDLQETYYCLTIHGSDGTQIALFAETVEDFHAIFAPPATQEKVG